MAFLQSRNGISILAGITAVIHLGIGFAEPNRLFILNGFGFLVLLYLTFWTPGFLKGQEGLIRWVFIGYTAVTIIMYFVSWGVDGFSQPVGLVTKIVELLLLYGLWRTK